MMGGASLFLVVVRGLLKASVVGLGGSLSWQIHRYRVLNT